MTTEASASGAQPPKMARLAEPGRPLRPIQTLGDKALPPLQFRGVVQVASTAAQVDAAVAAVYARCCPTVGFDLSLIHI
jgi:hypothetical protein